MVNLNNKKPESALATFKREHPLVTDNDIAHMIMCNMHLDAREQKSLVFFYEEPGTTMALSLNDCGYRLDIRIDWKSGFVTIYDSEEDRVDIVEVSDLNQYQEQFIYPRGEV